MVLARHDISQSANLASDGHLAKITLNHAEQLVDKTGGTSGRCSLGSLYWSGQRFFLDDCALRKNSTGFPCLGYPKGIPLGSRWSFIITLTFCQAHMRGTFWQREGGTHSHLLWPGASRHYLRSSPLRPKIPSALPHSVSILVYQGIRGGVKFSLSESKPAVGGRDEKSSLEAAESIDLPFVSKEEVVVGHADLAGSAVWHIADVAANDVGGQVLLPAAAAIEREGEVG